MSETKRDNLQWHKEQAASWSATIGRAKGYSHWSDILSDGMRRGFEMYFKHKRKVIALEKEAKEAPSE